MSKAVVLFIFMLQLGAAEVQGQTIKLTYRHGLSWSGRQVEVWRKGETVKATISSMSWQREQDSTRSTSVVDTTLELTAEKYEALVESILTISPRDLAKSATMRGSDGSSFELEYGSMQNSIRYESWTPGYDTKERGLTQFVETCKLILTTVGLKASRYF